MSSVRKVIGTLALLAVGTLGLLMSLCGGAFTITGLGTSEALGALVIAIPSLLVGLALLWFAGRKLRGRLGRSSGR